LFLARFASGTRSSRGSGRLCPRTNSKALSVRVKLNNLSRGDGPEFAKRAQRANQSIEEHFTCWLNVTEIVCSHTVARRGSKAAVRRANRLCPLNWPYQTAARRHMSEHSGSALK
jgi:hypothetical protein